MIKTRDTFLFAALTAALVGGTFYAFPEIAGLVCLGVIIVLLFAYIFVD